MKTAAAVEKQLTENSINCRLHHKTFLEVSAKTPHIRAKRNLRNVDRDNHGVLAMLGIEDHTAQSKISLHPEFVAFSFHLYGLSRRLLTYIIFYEMNNDTCRFNADPAMILRFKGFCSLFGEEEESEKTIKQAIRSLVRKNTIILVRDQEYMVNPLIAGGATESKRRRLIDRYCVLLQNRGLDTSIDFYPRYYPGL